MKDKWTAIIKPFLDLVAMDGFADAQGDGSMVEDSDSAPPSPSPSPPQSPPNTTTRPPASLSNYVQRMKNAYTAYPLFFSEEEAFWNGRPADQLSAPFPADIDTQGFVVSPQTFVAKPDPISPTARWLLDSLDITNAVRTREVVISQALAAKVKSMWDDEEEGRKVGGCKHGRDMTVLTLRSSEGPKAEGRLYFNPLKDVGLGECALVRLVDPMDTPAARGWELARITSAAERIEGKVRYQVRGLSCWVSMFVHTLFTVHDKVFIANISHQSEHIVGMGSASIVGDILIDIKYFAHCP